MDEGWLARGAAMPTKASFLAAMAKQGTYVDDLMITMMEAQHQSQHLGHHTAARARAAAASCPPEALTWEVSIIYNSLNHYDTLLRIRR